ncbi:MAG: hypothetical protein EON59_10285 [Alphaproteobacteria bacterium]|nr:MAG: hypothetical protein EON59_10285 [Alphaproteobacteria bacterium]
MADTSNVVRLPTALKRKVAQPQNKAGREARVALRASSPFRDRFIFPGIREQMAAARIITEEGSTPGAMLAWAILAEMDLDLRVRVCARLAKHALTYPDGMGRVAVEVARQTCLTVGQANDARRACDLLWSEKP